MRRSFIRLLALLLCLAAVSGLVPAALAGGFSGASAAATVWDRIYGYQAEYVRAHRLGEEELSYEDYCTIAGEIASIVQSSPDVVKGSCTYDPESGNATFFWDGTDGNAYGYSPSLASKLNGKDLSYAETAEGLETVSYAPQSGTDPAGGEVYVIGPWYGSDSSFTNQYKNEAQSVAEAINGTYTLYSAKSATLDNVAKAVQNGTVVFFDSHGVTDYDNIMSYTDGGYEVYDSVTKANTSYLTLTTNSGWTTEDKASVQGKFGSYKHVWSFQSTDGDTVHCVDGTAIAAHMTANASGNMIWMAICLGMATDGIFKPLREKGVDTVYGYSQSVSFEYDYLWEADFWNKMKDGEDVGTAFAYAIAQTGQWDFCQDRDYNNIGKARYYMCAFPNAVSPEDAYQGQRSKNPSSASAANQTEYSADYGACNIQTVASSWSLFGKHTVTVTVRNPEYGSASVSGNTITASPIDGYFVSEANVLSGEASTRISGNIIHVTPSSDCTVEIVFAPKVPVTVTCKACGVETATLQGYAGDPLILPDTAPDYEDWTFCGWSEEAVADTNDRPDFYEPGGSFVPSADTTLYAVYAKAEPGDGTGDWTLLQNEEALQPGLKIVFACSDYGALAGALNMTYLSKVDCDAFEEDTITELPEDALIFTLGGSEGEWTFETGAGTLYCSEAKKLNFSENGTGTWMIAASSGLTTVGSTERDYGTLQYNRSSPRFTTYTSMQTGIQIYYLDGSAGILTYSTTPVVCEHSHLTATPAKDPTCGEDGNIAYWTCEDCGAVFADAEGKTRISLSSTVIPATGNHTYGDYISNEDGTHSRACSVCTHKETEDCTFDDAVTPPTETEKGYTTHTCSVCAYAYTDSYTEPLGPSYTVTFTVPAGSGVTPPADMGCNRLGITLPAADDFTLDGVDYAFTGWVTEQLDHVETKPAEVLTGTYVASGNVTLMALYTYRSGEVSSDPALQEITSADDIADGDDIVITACGTQFGLYQETSGTSYVKYFEFTDAPSASAAADDPKMRLTFHKVKTGWIIGDDTNGYLYSSGSNNLALNTSGKTVFTFGEKDNCLTLITDGGRYLACRTDLTSSNADLWRLGGTNGSNGTSALVLYRFVPAGSGTGKTCYTTVLSVACAHTVLQFFQSVEPTCVDEGHTAYFYCPDCGTYFSDEACENEITPEETVIPATGVHTYGDPEWVWASGRSSAQAVFTCTVCKHSESVGAAVSVSEDKGVRYYTASVLFEGTTYTSDPEDQKEWIDYTVRFLDWDGTLISEATCHYGDTAAVPEDPVKKADETFTYPFDGWDKEVTSVTGDADYTAVYRSVYIDYTVTFTDWDGTVLSEKTYHYGDTVELPADPVRPKDDDNTYLFKEWTPAVAQVAGDAAYTASYTATPRPKPVVFGLDTANGGQKSETTVLIPSDGKTTLSKITSTFAAPEYILGDINGDGDIDGRDYIVVKKYVLGTADLTDRQLEIADINGDGEVDGIDYLLIKKHVLGTYTIPEPQPVEVPGPDYADFAVIVADADGIVQTVKQADGKSKSDLSVPMGGYAVAIPKAALDADPALKEAVGKLTAQRDRIELLNVATDGLADANGSVLTNASVRIVFGE